MSDHFTKIAVVDFEYEVVDGGLPNVLCMVAHVADEKLRHVRTIELWRGEFGSVPPPIYIGDDTLFIAYSAWAELTCFQMLGWEFPKHVYDLHTAYLASSNVLLPYDPGTTARKRASACRMHAKPTGSKAGSASTRVQWRRTSAKATGRNMASAASSTIARRT